MSNTPKLFQGSELRAGLLGFRREFLAIGALSLVVNVLMLSPTLFQLQITDRIFMSKSLSSLLSMSLIIVFFFLVMSASEWIRSMILVRAGLRFDRHFGARVFRASFDSQLKAKSRDPAEAISDLTNIRQFLTGNGIFAFFDAPWTPIYIVVVWMMNPVLGVASLAFVLVMVAQAMWTNRMTDAASGPCRWGERRRWTSAASCATRRLSRRWAW
jgi:ATP-binding cassette subfamily C exporter for protease/lipase